MPSFGGSVENAQAMRQRLQTTELKVDTVQANKSSSGSSTTLTKKDRLMGIDITLQKEYASGIRGYMQGNVCFVSENQVMHPVGRNVAIVDLEKGTTKFLNIGDKVKEVLALTVSPNLKRIALCEKRETVKDKPGGVQVTIYSSFKLTQQVSLFYNDPTVEFNSVCFSGDSKHVAALSSSQTRVLAYWRWDQSKLVSQVVIKGTGSKVQINPLDATQITISGDRYLRFWSLQKDNSLKGSFFSKMGAKREQSEHFVDHAWTMDNHLVAISVLGHIFVYQNDIVDDGTGRDMSAKASKTGVMVQRQKLKSEAGHNRFESIAMYNKGFVIGGTKGLFQVYEKTEDKKDPFLLIKVLHAGEHDNISCLSVSPSSESVACYTRNKQILLFSLLNMDNIKKTDESFKPLRNFREHERGITGLDICVNKPIIAMCGKDHTLRVFDYLTMKLRMVLKLSDEPQTVALHPAGNMVIVGLKDKVKTFHLLMDSLEFVRDLHLKHCTCVRFSNGGGMYAVAFGISVMVFNTYTGEAIATYPTGHIRQVLALAWSQDDVVIYSAGIDGCIYGWNLHDQKRVEEHFNKNAEYTDIAIDRCGSGQPLSLVACGSDGKIHEVHNTNSDKECTSIDADGETVTSLTVSHSNSYVFVGTSSGRIRIYTWPLPADSRRYSYSFISWVFYLYVVLVHVLIDMAIIAFVVAFAFCFFFIIFLLLLIFLLFVVKLVFSLIRFSLHIYIYMSNCHIYIFPIVIAIFIYIYRRYRQFRIHSGPIVRLCTTIDDFYLFSVAEDGTFFINRIIQGGARGDISSLLLEDHPNKGNMHTKVGLVLQQQVRDTNIQIAELNKKLKEVQEEAVYNIHMKDGEWGKKVRLLTDEYDEQLAAERERYEALQQAHESYVRQQHELFDKRENDHIKMIEMLENKHEHRMEQEMRRRDEADEKVHEIRLLATARAEQQDQDYQAIIEELQGENTKIVTAMNDKIMTLDQELRQNKRKFEEILHQAEWDEDKSVQEQKQLLAKAQEEQELLQTKLVEKLDKKNDLNRRLEEKMKEMQAAAEIQEQQYNELSADYGKLEGTLEHFAKHMQEREITLDDKDKVITKLRANERTLDNFRYVLNTRIKQLQAEQKPKDERIKDLRAETIAKDEELDRAMKERKSLETQIKDVKLKLDTKKGEVKKVRGRLLKKERELEQLENAITTIVTHTLPRDYEAAIAQLYKDITKKNRLSGDNDEGKSSLPDRGVIAESNRQRDYMEQTVGTLKRELKLAKGKMRKQNKVAMQQNSFLISECNNLRHDNLKYRRRNAELEGLVKKQEQQLNLQAANGTGVLSRVDEIEDVVVMPIARPEIKHSQSQPILQERRERGTGGDPTQRAMQSQSVELLNTESKLMG